MNRLDKYFVVVVDNNICIVWIVTNAKIVY